MNKLEEIFSNESLLRSWKALKNKNKTGGMDNVTLESFEKDLEKNINKLQLELLSCKYVPEPYKRIFIEKDNNEYRPIALTAIKDKLVQLAVMRFYNPLISKTFLDMNYAYRPGKSHRNAINRIRDYLIKDFYWVATLDIHNFFDSIDREILLNKCKCYFDDFVLRLIEMWIKTGSFHNHKYTQTTKGIPQGCIISPLLSNIYLHSLDKLIFDCGVTHIRYADNILLLKKDKVRLVEAKNNITDYLEKELKLNFNKTGKDIFSKNEAFTFCGILFKNNKRTITPLKFEKIKHDLLKTINGSALENLCEKLNESVEGIKRYYDKYDTTGQFIELENILRKLLAEKIVSLKTGNQISRTSEAKKHLLKLNFLINKNNKEKIKWVEKTIEKANLRLTEVSTRTTGTLPKIENSINAKKRKYQKLWYENLDLVVSVHGCQIGKSMNNIVIRNRGKVINAISANKIQNIIITENGVSLSSDVIKFCAEKNIKIDFFDKIGRHYSTLISGNNSYCSASELQASSLNMDKAKVIAKSIVISKIKNQISLIKYFTKNRCLNEEIRTLIANEINRMNSYVKEIKNLDLNIDHEDLRSKLFGYEGIAATAYWNIIKILIPGGYNFTNREHYGSQNLVNMMFNYAYGVLYSRIQAAVIYTGLNPNISFLHSSQPNKPSLVFDIIETFRAPAADRSVISMLTKKTKLTKDKNLLSKETKNKLAKNLLTRLHTETEFRSKRKSLNDIIIDQVKDIYLYLKNEIPSFKPYLSTW